MPANVEEMWYKGKVPWHGLGTMLPDTIEMEAAVAMVLAKLDWDVETAPIATDDAKRTSVEDWRVTRRVQDNTILGVVRKGYVPIQNRDAFAMFDSVVKTSRVTFETAGSLRGGSKVFITAKLPGRLEVGKGIGPVDEVDRYLLLNNPHDGPPTRMLFTPVRVVCENTLNVALYSKNDKDALLKAAPQVVIRHNADVQKQMKEGERLMAAALKYYERFGDFANFLYRYQLTQAQVNNIIAEVFPPNKKKEITPAIYTHRTEIARLFEEGKGHDKIRGSAWALEQAFSEYTDHGYSVAKSKGVAEDRSYSVLMGGARGIKNRATRAIAEAVL